MDLIMICDFSAFESNCLTFFHCNNEEADSGDTRLSYFVRKIAASGTIAKLT